MVDRKVVPFYEFYYQLKLMYLFLLHVVYLGTLVCNRRILRLCGKFSNMLCSHVSHGNQTVVQR
jgi:hypothetical protein